MDVGTVFGLLVVGVVIAGIFLVIRKKRSGGTGGSGGGGGSDGRTKLK